MTQNIFISFISVCDIWPNNLQQDSRDQLWCSAAQRQQEGKGSEVRRGGEGEENGRQARLIRHSFSQAWWYIPQYNLPAGDATTQTHQWGSLSTHLLCEGYHLKMLSTIRICTFSRSPSELSKQKYSFFGESLVVFFSVNFCCSGLVWGLIQVLNKKIIFISG